MLVLDSDKDIQEIKEIMDARFKKQKIYIDRYWMLFGFVIFISVLKAFIGFDPTDEAYSIALANRYVCGDYPILQDWNPTCLSGILVAPFVALSRFLFGGTDYVILFCRISYIIMSTLVAIYAFNILKNIIDKKYSFTIAIMYFLYAKVSIVNLSYNTVGTAFLLLAIILMLQCYGKDKTEKKCLLMGIVLSIAVIAFPYFAILCPIYILMFWLEQQLKTGNIIYFLTGVMVSLCIFFAYLFQGMTPIELINNIPYVISSSSGHGIKREFFAEIPNMIWILMKSTGGYGFLAFSGLLLYSILNYRKNNRTLFFGLQSLVFVFNMIYATCNDVKDLSYRSPGSYFLAITLYGLGILPLISKDKLLKYKSMFYLWYVTGIMASVCLYFSSDNGNIAFYHGLIYTAIGALFTLCIYLEDKKYRIIGILVLVVVCSISLTSRIVYIYRDSVNVENAVFIKEGPAKGIITTAEKYESYLQVYNDISNNITNKDIVVFTEFLPWGYLVTDARYGAYTEWRMLLDNEMQYKYMEEMKQFPTVIFKMNDHIPYNKKDNPDDIFLKRMKEYEIEISKTTVNSGTIYRLSNK